MAENKIIEIARSRFKLSQEAFSEIRKEALDDLEFRSGQQWPAELKKQREAFKRPSLTINRIPQFIRQITNDQRQNRPAIKVFPVDDKGDIQTAKIYQGIIKHIENNSNAASARDTAFNAAVTQSFGFYRIITDYVSPDSFNQEILVKRIANPFSVYIDPHSKEPDGSDMNWAFVVEEMSKDEFKSLYPKSELSQMHDWKSIGDNASDWVGSETCRIAEYFYKEYETKTLCLLENGEVFFKEEIPVEFKGLKVKKERFTQVATIKWCKLNGIEVLEETVWPGKWVPIFPVYGDELNIDGKRVFEGVVRHAKDPQKMYNFWKSSETESITLAPKAPYVAAEGQIPPEYKKMWQEANTTPQSVLIYKADSLGGQLLPPPQRNTFEPAIQAITNAGMLAADDLKNTTGIYDASLGARGNETSGRAILSRQSQSQTSNYHFIDNLNKTLKHEGRVLVDLIPKVYDTAQAVRIIGEDGENEVIRINEEFDYKGERVNFELGAGQYDVEIETGPSFATKRVEAAASMMDFAKVMPQHAGSIADLIAKNMDWPGSSEIAERIRKLLPPNVLDDSKKEVDPQVKAQMDQMNQMIEQLTAKLNEQNEIIKNKSLEIESRERIEFGKMETELQKELLKQKAPTALAEVQNQIRELEYRLNLLNFNQPIDFNESVPDQDATQPINPTGGQSPGQFMEE